MLTIKNESDIKALKEIHEAFISKDYSDEDWLFFHEKLVDFAKIINKYSPDIKSQIDISNQKLGFTNRDEGYISEGRVYSIGYVSAKKIMTEVIDSIN